MACCSGVAGSVVVLPPSPESPDRREGGNDVSASEPSPPQAATTLTAASATQASRRAAACSRDRLPTRRLTTCTPTFPNPRPTQRHASYRSLGSGRAPRVEPIGWFVAVLPPSIPDGTYILELRPSG